MYVLTVSSDKRMIWTHHSSQRPLKRTPTVIGLTSSALPKCKYNYKQFIFIIFVLTLSSKIQKYLTWYSISRDASFLMVWKKHSLRPGGRVNVKSLSRDWEKAAANLSETSATSTDKTHKSILTNSIVKSETLYVQRSDKTLF